MNKASVSLYPLFISIFPNYITLFSFSFIHFFSCILSFFKWEKLLKQGSYDDEETPDDSVVFELLPHSSSLGGNLPP